MSSPRIAKSFRYTCPWQSGGRWRSDQLLMRQVEANASSARPMNSQSVYARTGTQFQEQPRRSARTSSAPVHPGVSSTGSHRRPAKQILAEVQGRGPADSGRHLRSTRARKRWPARRSANPSKMRAWRRPLPGLLLAPAVLQQFSRTVSMSIERPAQHRPTAARYPVLIGKCEVDRAQAAAASMSDVDLVGQAPSSLVTDGHQGSANTGPMTATMNSISGPAIPFSEYRNRRPARPHSRDDSRRPRCRISKFR